ncbi:MAG: hypothetical protein E7314_00595 [Clostridiales bacterium]|nr:hypothetical protein [Clostridiales bacterium]
MNIFNTKRKIIAAITGGLVVVGGVAFGFRDQFLSDKGLYLKIEKENVEMLTDKLKEIKEEDLLGMFFADESNKSTTKTDVALNIKASGVAGDIASFFNSLKLSISDEVIQKEEYKNKKIALEYKDDELIDLNIVNDEKTVGISVPKLYDKWIVSDFSIAEFIAAIIKSDEATGTTNTMSISDIKSVLSLSKTEKQDFSNAIKYHLSKLEKTLDNVKFTKVSDDNFVYDKDNELVADSIKLELSEIETLARLSQILTKVKENGQLLDLFYNKVAQVKEKYGENNIITDYIPEKQEALKKINSWINEIDVRLAELEITDASELFDEDDKYIGKEGLEERYYSMVIYYDKDYKILKRAIYTPDNTEAQYEIVCLENFYMFKNPDEVLQDKIEIKDGIATHKFTKSYYKESYSFEGFKLTKVPKWIDNEEFLIIEIDSSNDNQKTILVEIPSIKFFKLFADITREEIGRNEINVKSKIGLDIKGERQYITLDKNIVRKSSVEKVDIYSNSININESTQEKLDMISDVVKGNTTGLSNAIKEKTGVDLTEVFEKVKDVPQKAIDAYKSLNSLGIIG